MINIAKHPVLLFGLGMVGGALVYKNRKNIIEKAGQAVDTGKKALLERKEQFLDLVAEATDTAGDSTDASGKR